MKKKRKAQASGGRSGRRQGGDWRVVHSQWGVLQAVAIGANINFPLVGVIPAVEPVVPNAPLPGEYVVNMVEAHIFVLGSSSTGTALPASGLIVDELDKTGATLAVLPSPAIELDMTREGVIRWLAHRAGAVLLPAVANVTAPTSYGALSFNWSGSVRIGGGQSLAVRIANSPNADVGFTCALWLRYRFSRVF